MRRLVSLRLLAIAALACIVGCSSDEGPSCSLDGGTQLADTPWPKFRADTANSVRAAVSLDGNRGSVQVLFPPAGTIGPVQTTPILADNVIYLGASDGNVYVVDYDGQPVTLEEQIMVNGAITGSPLLGANGVLFVPSNSLLSQFNVDGSVRNATPVIGFVASAPNIWNGDGTVWIGSLAGSFQGVCPNGVARWALSFPPTQSSSAIVQDPTSMEETPIILMGGLNGQVRAFSIRGRQKWSLFASADVTAAILVDESAEQFYVADTSGRVIVADLANGQPVPLPTPRTNYFVADAGITASPALGRDDVDEPRLYVGDQAGTLYAIERATGLVRWRFEADGPIASSPAVATGGARDVIVFGADVLGAVSTGTDPVPVGGMVYAVRDDGDRPTLLWSFDAEHSIGASSPSIGTDGTVYIGRSGSRLGTGSNCPGGTGNCLINDGGALYAIGP